MSFNYSLLSSVLIIVGFIIAATLLFPGILPAVFLLATLAVALIGMVGGLRMGIISFLVTSAVLFTLPLSESLSTTEIIIRYVGFAVTSLMIGIVNHKLIGIEKNFRRNQQQLNIISDSLSDVLITIDSYSKIIFVNPAVKTLFGWNPNEVVGQNITELMPENLRDHHIKGLNRYLTTNAKKLNWKATEIIGLRKNGSEFPAEISFGEFREGHKRFFSAIIRDTTQRIEFNEKLAQLASIVESSEDAIISKDFDGAILSWNKGAETIFQYKADEIIGKNIRELFPEDKIKEEDEIIEKVRAGDKISHYETIRKRKDGTLFPVSLTVSPIKNDKGEVIGASKIARDITERKKTEQELQKSQERYKTFVDNSEQAIWMIEYNPPIDTSLPVEEQIDAIYSNGLIAEANPRMTELYGFPDVESIIGKPSTIVGERSEVGEALLKKFVEEDYSITNFESQTTKDGLTRFGTTSFKGIVIDGKMIRGWLIQNETTAQRIQAQALQKSEERYKAFINESEDAIWRVEIDPPISTQSPIEDQVQQFFARGYIAEANKATPKFLNAENVEAVLNKPLDVLGGRSDADNRVMVKFIEDGYSLQNFESCVEKDGKNIYGLSSVIGILKDELWVRAWVIRRDITDDKEYAQEKERLLQEAEKAKESLLVANAEKDRFLANLSHELRTPLVSILGYSSMLLETKPKPEELQKMINVINKNAKLQVELIEDLLDLSRIISGKIELSKDFFFVSEMVSDAVTTFEPQSQSKDLKIVTNLEECSFYGDRKRLYQVLLNLISNAVKFTEEGEITVLTECKKDHLEITVRDTGIGISKKNQGLLFKPFKQIDSSSTRAQKGLGLGLSIVKNLVELHEGSVHIESEVGVGSEFKIYLPIMQFVKEEELVEIIEDRTTISRGYDFNGVNILLVEDDPDSGEFIKYLYEANNAKVTWVMSAKEARELLTTNEYNLYIFDLSMPDEDGISLLKSLRNKGDTTSAVALTAFVNSYYESKALESGFQLFIKKPSSLADLLSVVKLVKPID